MEFIQKTTSCGVQSPHEENHGRRYVNNVQRLRARFHIYRCGPTIFSGTRILDPKALQALPSGKEEWPGGWRLRLPFGSVTGNSGDLLGLWSANYCTFWAAWRQAGILPGLLSGAQRQQRRRVVAWSRSSFLLTTTIRGCAANPEPWLHCKRSSKRILRIRSSGGIAGKVLWTHFSAPIHVCEQLGVRLTKESKGGLWLPFFRLSRTVSSDL